MIDNGICSTVDARLRTFQVLVLLKHNIYLQRHWNVVYVLTN